MQHEQEPLDVGALDSRPHLNLPGEEEELARGLDQLPDINRPKEEQQVELMTSTTRETRLEEHMLDEETGEQATKKEEMAKMNKAKQKAKRRSIKSTPSTPVSTSSSRPKQEEADQAAKDNPNLTKRSKGPSFKAPSDPRSSGWPQLRPPSAPGGWADHPSCCTDGALWDLLPEEQP